jgi:hypothetical protein
MGQYYKPINIDKKQFVYSHDYGNGLKLMEHSWLGNTFVGVVEDLIAEGGDWHGDRIVWAGDYADPEKGRQNNLFTIVDNDTKHKIGPKPTGKKYRYVINDDTKEFVDTKKIPLSDVYYDENGKAWPYSIHPLPILTCEGNGRGGGDFHKGDDLVGKWARNRVTVATRKPKGYTEIEFNLYEGLEPAVLKKDVKPENVE